MESVSKWALTDAEKDEFIETLTPNLSALRMQADISQGELANLIGISRQTYSAIERRIRKMSWSTYLSLVLFFDHNKKTHKMLRTLSLFPKELVIRFNDGIDYSNYAFGAIFGNQNEDILECLDENAKRTVGSIIMLEYARCTQLPSEAIVKSFGGIDLLGTMASPKDIEAAKSIRTIRKKTNEE